MRTSAILLALSVLCFAPFARSEIHLVAEVKSGTLLGGSDGQKWVHGERAAKEFKPGITFRLFEMGKEAGTTKGQKVGADMDLCPDVQLVSFDQTPSQGVIALAAPWKALPRAVREMDTTQETYRNAVKEYLVGRGLRDPKVKVTQIIRADLDGDGAEEVLVSATNYDAEGESAPTSSRVGDYSFVLLRQSRNGKVETRLIDGEFYKKGGTFNAPNVHRVMAILDLDGDGKMELVLTSNYYEGGTTTIYRYTPSSIKTLVSVSCGA